MTTSTPLNSATSTLPSSSAKQGLCLPFHKAMKELPVFLQPSDEQEQKELAMFLSQVDVLHKPVNGKFSARFVFNFLEQMVKPATPTIKGPSEITVPEQLQEITQNIAFEIAKSVINDFDLPNTIISVLNALQEVSWETKAALTITTFVLTFGDNGLNLCEESKVSLNEIKMFDKLEDGYKHQLDGSDNLFTIIFKLIDYICKFEILPTTYMISEDPKFKVARTRLIVAIYWIIRIIVAASTSRIMEMSNRQNEFDRAILTLRELPSMWSKKLKDLVDKDLLKAILLQLQDLLREEVDIEAYNRVKEIIEQRNHRDNMKVLNALFSSTEGDVQQLYDCLRKREVHLDELKGAYVLLYISGLENIAPEVDETMLNEFVDSFDLESRDELGCKLLWMPVVQHKEATEKFMMKPLLDLCYVVNQKLNRVVEYAHKQQMNFKDWYSIGDPSRITNEVKKLLRDDWKYKGEPIIVVLDPQGNVIHHNAIHIFHIWGIEAFPFTSERVKNLYRVVWVADFAPIYYGLSQLHDNWRKGNEYYFYYGGENMEWIRSFTGLVHEVERELGFPINMVYVGRSHDQELVQNVNEENLSHCLSDQFYLWLFWKRLESILHTYTGDFNNWLYITNYLKLLQVWINYEKSNVGWAILNRGSFSIYGGVWHGKVVLSTLKEFKLWKKKALSNGFRKAFESHYKELYKKISPCKCLEFPTDALKAPLETMECPDCGNQMQKYSSFVCYHPSPTRKG